MVAWNDTFVCSLGQAFRVTCSDRENSDDTGGDL